MASMFLKHSNWDFSIGFLSLLQDQPLYPGSRISVAESLLLIMGHSLRHDSSKAATESLLNLLEAHLPEATLLPTSKYKFFRHFGGSGENRSKHFYCNICLSYIGASEVAQVLCNKCSMQHDVGELLKPSSYFFVIDMESQICDVLKTTPLRRAKNEISLDVTDITESIGYRKLPLGPDDVSLTFNTDGVPLFESSSFGIWPLFAQINELPYKDRIKNILLAGLWFGPRKPVMNTFLLPFVKQINELSATGIRWQNSKGNEKISKVFPGPCTTDSVARCELMGMTQFNGKHGCSWCEEPGQVVARGNGHCRVYPAPLSTPKLRTHESFAQHARKARTKRKKVSCGVKTTSVLTLLTYFSFCSGFVVDYMHAVCSGVVKATTLIWLKSGVHQGFRLRSCQEEVDKLLLSLSPVWELSKLP
ncbi:uncharacterized protein LOC144110009 [Amblyomma americanum]